MRHACEDCAQGEKSRNKHKTTSKKTKRSKKTGSRDESADRRPRDTKEETQLFLWGCLSNMALSSEARVIKMSEPSPISSGALFGWVWLGVAAYAISVAGYTAYKIRMGSIEEYGPVIHEFDPYFNFRATEVSLNLIKRVFWEDLN
jgi:hypothetical protein